ncbi:Gamma-glutamyl [Castilleja foliolosa]|uniref:folate gamma-glutamyl hydrolase n=1 Tax=Castilleja foliolosa TaxID=1961234 RepID=A0ABD3CNE5_9LAMI
MLQSKAPTLLSRLLPPTPPLTPLPLSLQFHSPPSPPHPLLMNYLWIPLLIALSKELTLSAGANSTASPLVNPRQVDAVTRCPAADPNLNFRPVIGILSHPGDGASGRLSNASKASYIAASYVKFVESAGARVIPLIYNEPTEVLHQVIHLLFTFYVSGLLMVKLNLVNGVIFTGGWAKSGLYFEVVESIFKNVLRKNDAGDRFPLLAICLGFELVTMIVSKDKNILEKFSGKDQASTLQFTDSMNINGTVFQRFPPVLINKLSTDCLVMLNHRYGISLEKFQKTKSLWRFFEILTTSADHDDKFFPRLEVYVSTMRAHKYPVTAVQWHPEKNAFEWGLSRIPHSEDAVQVTQHFANFIVREARMSMNRPPAREVLDNLIYNYSPTFCGKAGRGFDEVYIFSS